MAALSSWTSFDGSTFTAILPHGAADTWSMKYWQAMGCSAIPTCHSQDTLFSTKAMAAIRSLIFKAGLTFFIAGSVTGIDNLQDLLSHAQQRQDACFSPSVMAMSFS
jgi:hypothetical protein